MTVCALRATPPPPPHLPPPPPLLLHLLLLLLLFPTAHQLFGNLLNELVATRTTNVKPIADAFVARCFRVVPPPFPSPLHLPLKKILGFLLLLARFNISFVFG